MQWAGVRGAVDPEKLRPHTSRGLLDTALPRFRQSISHPALRAYPAPQQHERPHDSTMASLLRRSSLPLIFLYPGSALPFPYP